MLTGKRFRLLIGIFLVIVAMIAFYGPAKADDDFDQNFLYLPQILAPDVSSFIGAVTYKIPIQVPQGRGGIQPSINLYYNSFVGNGWIGVGWDLNMGYIQRSTKYGASYACDPGSWSSTKCGTNYEKSDFFVSANGSSSELVIRPNWDSGNHTYGKKIEQDFSKYYFNSKTWGWEVTDKQGTVHYYGSTTASRLANSFGTFKWFLDKVQDVYGNYMTLSYYNDSPNGQLYLQEIDYTANGSLSYSNKVVFTLSSQARTAADTPVSYASKAQISTAYRLRSISVFTSVNNKWQLASKYALTYTQSGDTSRSLLQQVIQYGSDGTGTRSVLPDNAFTYQSCGNKFVWEENLASTSVASTQKITWATSQVTGIVFDDNPSGSTGNIVTNVGIAARTAAYNTNYKSFWLANLNLSGNPDIVYVDNQSPPHIHSITISCIWSGSCSPADNDLGHLSANIYNGAGHARMADVNGDGLLDFIYDTCTNAGCSPVGTTIHVLANNGNGTFGPDTVWGQRPAQAAFKMADVNGDGKADLVFADINGNIFVMLSNGSGFNATVQWGALNENDAFNLVDVNGDGLPDIVYLDSSGNFQVLLNTGVALTGFNAETTWGSTGSYTPSPGYVFGDVNGDGLPDVVFDSGSGIMVMANTGSSFMNPKKWGARQYPYATGAKFQVADFEGLGLQQFAYDAAVSGIHQFEVIQTYNSQASDMMNGATTGIGGVFTILYSPSQVSPSRYQPYVVQTPYSIASNDGNGNIYTAYWAFNGGYYDFFSREFRGFGNPTQYLNDSFIDYTYLQDGVGKGLMTDKFSYDSNWNQYKEWQYYYYDTPGNKTSGITYPNTSFPASYQAYEIHYDDNGNTPQKIGTGFAFDAAYGNVISRTMQGDVNLPTPAGSRRVDKIQYAGDTSPARWLLARPSQVTTTAGDGTNLAQTIFLYSSQNNSWSGRPTSKTFCYSGSRPFNFSNCTPGVDPTISYAYDSYGNLISQVDPNGNPATTISYDSTETFPQLITDPAGHSTQLSYYSSNSCNGQSFTDGYLFSKPVSKTDLGNNIETDYCYDLFGRLLNVVEQPNDTAAYPTKTYSYNNYGNGVGQQNITLQSRVASGTTSVYSKSMYFDGLGRVISRRAAGPGGTTIYVDTAYDVNGRVGEISYPYIYGVEQEKWTTYTYDPLGRLLTQTNPDTTSSTFTYAQGTTGYTDPAGRKRTELRDAFGQLVSVTQYPNANTSFSTLYQFDPLGNLLSITDPENNKTSINYDSLSRRTAMADPDMGSWTYGYDSNGNLIQQVDANGSSTSFDYDALNRIISKWVLLGGQNLAYAIYTYDQQETGFLNGVGRLTTVQDPSGSTSFSYDRDGRVLSQASTVNGSLYTLNKLYDDLGRITQISYPDGDQVNYTYDAGGNLSGVTGAGSANYAAFGNYTGLGQPQSVTYGNEATTRLTYNTTTDSRLHSMVTSNGTPLQNLTYSYDGDGNILTVSDGVDSTRDLWFGYDGLNRLTTASSPNTNYGNITFEYSPSGNITYNSRVGSYSYSGPQPHAVTAAGSNAYGYDANGNMTTRNGQAMTYDQENRLLKAGSYSYVYNYKGMRAIKSSGTPSSTTAYMNNLYECTNATCTKHIFAGSRRIASKTGSSVIYYYHPDLLGGLNIATDANGNPAETRFYYPYGEDWIATGSVDLHYKFTDQESDSETALYYYKARYYDPHIGRFITTDPLLQAVYDPATFPRLTVSNYLPSAAHIRGNKATGKAVSTQKNRTGTNPYTYALNNPTALIDPTGLDVNIIINRTTYTPSSIVGTINVTSTVVNGTFSGYTLENATPPNPNLPLPQGTYSAFSTNGTVLTQGRIALEVPDSINDLSKGYIEIHTGNEPDDATGCFVVGTTTTTDWVGNSRVAMDSINSIIAYDGSGKIMVYVTGSSTAPEAAPNSAPDNPTLTSPPQQDTLTQGSQEQVIPAPPPSSNPGPGPGSGDDYNDDDDDG